MTHADSTTSRSSSDDSGNQPPARNPPDIVSPDTSGKPSLPPIKGSVLGGGQTGMPPPPPAAKPHGVTPQTNLPTGTTQRPTANAAKSVPLQAPAPTVPQASAPVAPQLPAAGTPHTPTPVAPHAPAPGTPPSSAGTSRSPVPPPPPPRSTLAPIRKPQEPTVSTGVGSAKGVRWRGELAGVGEASRKPAPTDSGFDELEPPTGGSEDPNARDQVTREAPSWLVSMVIHLILLLILAFISTPAGTSIGTLMLSIGQSIRDSPVEFAEFEISALDNPNDSEVMEDVEAEVDLDSLFEVDALETPQEVVPVEIGEGALELVQPMFNGRSGAIKAALLARFGGTIKTQNAVKLGLEWLKRNQLKDGCWSMRGPFNDGGFTENKTAATAMALLAYLGDGHTHKKGDYQEVVERGMKWLVKQQDRQGFFAKNARSHEKMYAQAQASIAICELYGMSGDSWLRPHAQQAIDFAEKAQSDAGGWRYEPNFDSDTSMTGWYVMALESGRAAKLDVNVTVLNRVMLYLDDAASYDGAAYGYQARNAPSSAMTAEGLLCRQYIGWKRDHPPMVRGISALLDDAPFDIRDQDVYYWYYATQVLHHFGGSPWRRWNDVMKVELPKSQVKTGRESGSWAPQRDRWGKNSGRLYTTCLSLFCLEVYYRHMPIYDTASAKGAE